MNGPTYLPTEYGLANVVLNLMCLLLAGIVLVRGEHRNRKLLQLHRELQGKLDLAGADAASAARGVHELTPAVTTVVAPGGRPVPAVVAVPPDAAGGASGYDLPAIRTGHPDRPSGPATDRGP